MSLKSMDTNFLKILSFVLVGLTFFQGCSPDHNTTDHGAGLPQPLSFSQVRLDGPLCLGFSGEIADIDLPWSVLVDDSGRPFLDSNGQPQVTDSSGRTMTGLQQISALWLVPDIHDPIPKRVLFLTRAVE